MSVFNRIGPYEIQHEIGRGGMAVVFLARDSRTAADVALKLVRDGSGHEEREILEAETRGAQLQKQFSSVSSRVPQVYEFGTDGGYFYVAMEYLEGENLSDAIARGPMPMEQALSIAGELCRFVEDAHGFEPEGGDRPLRSLLHGDLKPRNIRLTPAGQVKVLDFGIAKALSLSRKVTRNDFGSVAYLSPERLESGDVDQYADFWAIGVMLYELLTGEQAFRAPDTRRLEKLIVSRSQPPLLAELEPVALRAVLSKLLAPEPGDRYASARAIREDIERCLAGTATDAEQHGWPRSAVPDDATRATHQPAIDPEQTRRTTKAVVAAADPGDRHTGRAAAASGAIAQSVAAAAQRRETARRDAALSEDRRHAVRHDALHARAQLVVSRGSRCGNGADHRARRDWDAVERVRLAGAAQRAGFRHRRPRERVDDADRDAGRSRLRKLSHAAADGPRGAVASGAHGTGPRAADAAAQYASCAPCFATATVTSTVSTAMRSKARRLPAEAQREYADAVAAFREAAELRSDWADPYLGLARTFIYGLDDVERGADALLRAERAGYTPGNREAAQLGDGYRTRADTLLRSARDVTGLSQERDYLTRAAESYRQALEHYAKATDYTGVPRNIALSQRSLTTVERRLEALLLYAPPSFEAESKPWR